MTNPETIDARLALPAIAQRLRGAAAALKGRGVSGLWVFGSAARGEAGENSDIDLFAEFDPQIPVSLVTLASLRADLTDLLGTRGRSGGTEQPSTGRARGSGTGCHQGPVSPRTPRHRLDDILAAAEDALAFAGGIDAAAFGALPSADRRTYRALKNALTEIGEAVKALPPDILARHPSIDWAGLGRASRHRVPRVFPPGDAPATLDRHA